MRKVQVSFDFLAIVIFAFIIFLEMFEVYAVESSSARIREGMMSATRIASSVARTINEVCKKNETSATVTIPETLDTGDTYHLSIRASGRRVDVFWPISTQNRSIGVPILTNDINEFNLSKTTDSNQSVLAISNINGSINVSGG
ncbi:MAG: hypothetical protein NTY73_02905 [Candidatus Micrarchaeota archaeon]|nr:hypothetical protein [Candidatus Micrarchaeota archaeon]